MTLQMGFTCNRCFFNVNLRSVLSRYNHLLCVQTEDAMVDAADDIMLKFGICSYQDHLPIHGNRFADLDSWLSSDNVVLRMI